MERDDAPVAETLGDGHDERSSSSQRERWLVGAAAVVAGVAVLVVFTATRSNEPRDAVDDPVSDATITAVRADVLGDDGADSLVVMRFDGLPPGDRLVDVAGLPDRVSYAGSTGINIPGDGDVDVSFLWEAIDCTKFPPSFVTLDLQIARPGDGIAYRSIRVDADDAFERAWADACNGVRD